MQYPAFLKKINFGLAVFSGILVCIIALLSAMEAISRGLGNPTVWSIDISCYLMVISVFLSGGYVFQEKGYIAVDFIQQAFGKWFGLKMQKLITIVSYIFALVFLGFVFRGLVVQSQLALLSNKLTYATIQIPIIYMYAIMFIGLIWMVVTVLFIILDLLSKSNDYLNT